MGHLTFREGQIEVLKPNDLHKESAPLLAVLEGSIKCGLNFFNWGRRLLGITLLARQRGHGPSNGLLANCTGGRPDTSPAIT